MLVTAVGTVSAQLRHSPEGGRDIPMGSPKLQGQTARTGRLCACPACSPWTIGTWSMAVQCHPPNWHLQGSLELSSAIVLQFDPVDTSSIPLQTHVSKPMMSQHLSIWSRIPHRDTLVSHPWGTPQESLPGPCSSLDKFQSQQSRQLPEVFSQLAYNTSLLDLQCPWGREKQNASLMPQNVKQESQPWIALGNHSSVDFHFLDAPEC